MDPDSKLISSFLKVAPEPDDHSLVFKDSKGEGQNIVLKTCFLKMV